MKPGGKKHGCNQCSFSFYIKPRVVKAQCFIRERNIRVLSKRFQLLFFWDGLIHAAPLRPLQKRKWRLKKKLRTDLCIRELRLLFPPLLLISSPPPRSVWWGHFARARPIVWELSGLKSNSRVFTQSQHSTWKRYLLPITYFLGGIVNAGGFAYVFLHS